MTQWLLMGTRKAVTVGYAQIESIQRHPPPPPPPLWRQIIRWYNSEGRSELVTKRHLHGTHIKRHNLPIVELSTYVAVGWFVGCCAAEVAPRWAQQILGLMPVNRREGKYLL